MKCWKLSLIYWNERSKITMNGNFELFNISRASFLRYLDLCNMQAVVVIGSKRPSLNDDGINYENVPQHSKQLRQGLKYVWGNILGGYDGIFCRGVARQCSNLCYSHCVSHEWYTCSRSCLAWSDQMINCCFFKLSHVYKQTCLN